MNPLYFQLFGVIAVILMLGSLGILQARHERVDREARSFPGRTGMPALDGEEALRLAEEVLRRRSGAESERTTQHELEHK